MWLPSTGFQYLHVIYAFINTHWVEYAASVLFPITLFALAQYSFVFTINFIGRQARHNIRSQVDLCDLRYVRQTNTHTHTQTHRCIAHNTNERNMIWQKIKSKCCQFLDARLVIAAMLIANVVRENVRNIIDLFVRLSLAHTTHCQWSKNLLM